MAVNFFHLGIQTFWVGIVQNVMNITLVTSHTWYTCMYCTKGLGMRLHEWLKHIITSRCLNDWNSYRHTFEHSDQAHRQCILHKRSHIQNHYSWYHFHLHCRECRGQSVTSTSPDIPFTNQQTRGQSKQIEYVNRKLLVVQNILELTLLNALKQSPRCTH